MWLGFADRGLPGEELPSAMPPGEGAERADAGDLLLTLMPWAVSFLLHAGVVLLSVFLVWTTADTSPGEEPIVPIARLSDTPGAPLTMQTVETPVKAETTTAPRQLSSASVAARRVGEAGGASAAVTPASAQAGWGSLGLGAATPAAANPFDAGLTSGAGDLQVKFYGSGGNARKIVYLVDASGSLIDTLPFVILELKRSITELSDRQQFTVIFVKDEPVEVPVPNLGLKTATADARAKVIQWIDPGSGHIVAGFSPNHIKALQLALRYRPDLIFLLSDNITGVGRYEVDQNRLLAEIQRVNVANTKINTIQFLYEDKLKHKGMRATMELIADRSGGTYKFLDGRELGIE